jgi:hypothetical protein
MRHLQTLEETIFSIHVNYGKGNILSIENGQVTAQCTSCEPHTRKYTVTGDKVRYLGKSRKFLLDKQD